MHPRGKIASIEERKKALLVRIQTRRETTVAGVRRLLEPVVMVEQGLDLWRQLQSLLNKDK